MAEQKTNKHELLIDKTTKALRSLAPIFAFVRPYKLVAAAAMMILVVTALAKLSMGQGFHFIINNGFVNGTEALLMQANLLFIVLIILLAAGTAMRFYLMTWLGERVSADIRKAVFKRIIHLHPGYFEENRSGEIMSRLTADTSVLQSIIGTSFAVSLGNILMLIGSVVMLLVINFKLTLLVIAFVPVILIPMSFFGRKVRQLASSSQGAVADISTFAGEIIQNIKVVQGYTRESQEQQAFDHEAERAFELAKHRVKHRALMIGAVSFLTFSAIDLMFWVGGMDVQAGRMSGGELGAFVFYAVMVAFSMAGVAEIYGELQRAAGASKRLIELLQTESQICDPTSPLPFVSADEASNDTVIEFKQVNFHYPSRPDSPALTDINLQIPKNKVTAIVGPSGAGKTTLFELLQRFYDLKDGCIEFYQRDITQLSLKQLRQATGVVTQHPVLFSADLWHNIRYGNPQASDEAVMEAARRAHADGFIQQLPEGYGSFLGEKGVRLSGGEQQRVALARAILKNPQVLLLDEATSALDAKSEFHVQAALSELMVNRTTLIIAHRLSTVTHADMIVVMEQGRIVATGDHSTLYETSSLYRELCDLQFGDPKESTTQ